MEEGSYELADLSPCERRAIITGGVDVDLAKTRKPISKVIIPISIDRRRCFRPRGVSQSASDIESNAGRICAVIFQRLYLQLKAD